MVGFCKNKSVNIGGGNCMPKKYLGFASLILLTMSVFVFSGCTFIFQKGRRVDVEKISVLKNQLSEMERAKAELERRLQDEIGNNEVRIDMQDKGLVITFVAEVLFASGKDALRGGAAGKLSKVAKVLNTTVKDYNVGVEGHTDNIPIKHSGWKSNWELSSARALSVLHYLKDKHSVPPRRLSATGYGEFHPIDSNDVKEGRQRNRRVEIVILPKVTKKGR